MTENETTTEVILWWNGEGKWGARAKQGRQRGWAYVDDLAELPAAAAEAARKAGGSIAPGSTLDIQRPPTVARLVLEIAEAEAHAAELREQLRAHEQHIDQMRQKAFSSLRRARLRPDDALHLLAHGFAVEVPVDERAAREWGVSGQNPEELTPHPPE